MPFPVFDLGRFERAASVQRAELAAEVDHICRTTGFLAVTGHGVPEPVIAAVWERARAFFDLAPDEKSRVRPPAKGSPYGYLGPDAEALARSRGEDSPPDLKESFNGSPPRAPTGLVDAEALAFCYAPTPWPATPEGFVEAWTSY